MVSLSTRVSETVQPGGAEVNPGLHVHDEGEVKTELRDWDLLEGRGALESNCGLDIRRCLCLHRPLPTSLRQTRFRNRMS